MCSLDVGCGPEKTRPLVSDGQYWNFQIFSLCPFSPDTSPMYETLRDAKIEEKNPNVELVTNLLKRRTSWIRNIPVY
jgi:hypothetical protein